MRVIVAGSRTFNDYSFLEEAIVKYFGNDEGLIPNDLIIVSGGARGADSLGERFATEYQLTLKRYPAEWNKYGRSAGYIRNEEMARNADALIAFWDGKSRGTEHMINLANKYKLRVHVVKF